MNLSIKHSFPGDKIFVLYMRTWPARVIQRRGTSMMATMKEVFKLVSLILAFESLDSYIHFRC